MAPGQRKLAGLDYGRARVGVAVSDDLGALAHPRGALDAKDPRALMAALRTLAADEALEAFVLGLPLEMTGEEGPQARRVRAFAAQLERATSLPVHFVDERLTSVQAARRLDEGAVGEGRRAGAGRGRREGRAGRSKGEAGRIDGASAAVLLQSWLDAHRGDSTDEAP